MERVSDKNKKYLELLERSFKEDEFYEFIGDLLNLESKDIINETPRSAGSDQYKAYIDTAKLYAKYEDNKKRKIGVIVVKLKDNKNPSNARTLQRNFIAHLLSDEIYGLDCALTAIYSNTDNTWRLSFVKTEIEIEVGKLKTKVSPAKRYSYLFGDDEPNHTAKEQLLGLLENNSKKYSVEEIEDKFSVEKVTKDFFEKYKENYLKIKEMLEKNEEFISESKRCDFTSEEFTKKLMGQIVFIYFLQKKGWLGVKLVPNKMTLKEYQDLYDKQDILKKKVLDKFYISCNNEKIVKNNLLEKQRENKQDIELLSDIFVGTEFDKSWGTGTKRFIRDIFNNCNNRNKNFFDDYLEPFFYDGLNHKRKNQYFSLFNCKVPFLNGGLFEPIDNYLWESSSFSIDNKVFSNENEDGILDFFDRYNFTMNEEEPLEKEVAVDPEMLGKIFENLLDVKDRKSKGAFYTPREIVHYMCQESLANFLVNKVGVDYDEIKEFIQYGELIRDMDLKDATRDSYLVGKSIFENIDKIDKALINIKIADPAVGSGAFPLGILNEIVKLRDIITSYYLLYNKFGLFDKKYDEKIIAEKRSIYKIKWNTIKNSIYAVDIENSAVDITKLRLWLSIVVDQVSSQEPEPLPNLDCKIMQGNSLVDEYAGIKLIDERFVEELKDRENITFNSQSNLKRSKMSNTQIEFGDGQKKAIINELIDLKKQLYEENNASKKKELLEKIKNHRRALIRENFRGTNKEKEIFAIDESHNKPYFAWMLEFIEVFIENDGFDIVIGNPPYKTFGLRNNDNLNDSLKELYSRIYKNSAEYKINLYPMFMELAFILSNDIGLLSYIVPDSFLVGKYFSKIRKLILNESSIINLMLIKAEVFESASVGQSTVFLFNKKKNNKNTNVIMCKDVSEITSQKLVKYSYNQSFFENSENNAFYMIFSKQEFDLINKVQANGNHKLKDYIKFRSGLISKEGQDKIKSEIDLGEYWGRGIFSGEAVKRYMVEDRQQYICYKKELIKSGGITTVNYFEPKLFVRQTGDKITCAYDNNNLLALNNVHIGNLINKSDIDCLFYIVAILNTKIIDKYYKIISLEEGRAMAQIDIDMLEKIPLPDDESYKENIIKLCKEVIANRESDNEIYNDKIEELVKKAYNI